MERPQPECFVDLNLDQIVAWVIGERRDESHRLEQALDAVDPCILVKGDRVTVGLYEDQVDDSDQVTKAFERFQQDATTEYRDTRPEWREEDFAGLAVLDLVAKLYPDLFGAPDDLLRRYLGYLDGTVALSAELTTPGKHLVCNAIVVRGPQLILVISGPNYGGETTLARTVG